MPLTDQAEQIRTACINGRRVICGKILKILPEGLVVDSGYTSLLEMPAHKSWLVPGAVSASRPEHAVEAREPGSPCIGAIFLTDLPKGRRSVRKPKLFDYVVITGYPAGHYTYVSVGTVQKTVRRYSASLPAAVYLNYQASQKSPPPNP